MKLWWKWKKRFLVFNECVLDTQVKSIVFFSYLEYFHPNWNTSRRKSSRFRETQAHRKILILPKLTPIEFLCVFSWKGWPFRLSTNPVYDLSWISKEKTELGWPAAIFAAFFSFLFCFLECWFLFLNGVSQKFMVRSEKFTFSCIVDTINQE